MIKEKSFRILSVMALVSLLLQLRFIFWSETGYLVSSWMVDDTFYYLKPAWLLKLTGVFTFDGIHVTYGFQPLWMLLLTLLAHCTGDKVEFIRLAMAAGALFYCATAFLLFALSRRWFDGTRSLIAPAIWLFNYDLISIYVTGKENALYAFLLVLVLLMLIKVIEGQPSLAMLMSTGIACGMLILSRVNSVLFVALTCATILFLTKERWSKRWLNVGVIASGALVTMLPWLLYAQKHFGGLLPYSGVRKLIGSEAALLHYAERFVPFNIEWMGRLLPHGEQLFLPAADKLAQPSLSSIAFFLCYYLPSMSIGFGIPEILKPAFKAHPSITTIIASLIILVVLAGIAKKLLLVKEFQSLKGVRSLVRREQALCVLFLFAVLNTMVNGLLLPSFLYWGKWYAVPETLSCVLLFSFVLVLFFSDMIKNIQPRVSRLIGGILSAVLVVQLGIVLSPRIFSPANEYQHDAWEAHAWLDHHLPSAAKVGSWSAGVLGYFTDSTTVINLDGLGNSPGFVDSVSRNSLLYEIGLSKENAMWNYIRQNRIQYIADADFDRTIGTAPFLGVIPPGNFTIVYQSSHLLDWHEPQGMRRFVIIRLSYDIEH